MRRHLFAANWKMYKTTAEVRQFVETFATYTLPSTVDISISASFPLLPVLVESLREHQLAILPGAQNMSTEEEGAFTGEVSGAQLHDVGCRSVILGHSERRRLFGETNTILNKKIHQAIRSGLLPIYSMGETEDERMSGHAFDVVRKQLEEGIAGVSVESLKTMAVAYEPVWAIGTGKTATPEQAEEMLAFMRTLLPVETRILYGGSVNAENAQALLQQPSVDGFLIGGASLEPESFWQIISAQK